MLLQVDGAVLQLLPLQRLRSECCLGCKQEPWVWGLLLSLLLPRRLAVLCLCFAAAPLLLLLLILVDFQCLAVLTLPLIPCCICLTTSKHARAPRCCCLWNGCYVHHDAATAAGSIEKGYMHSHQTDYGGRSAGIQTLLDGHLVSAWRRALRGCSHTQRIERMVVEQK